MTSVAVLAVLSTISAFIDNSLVSRLLRNIAKKTTTKLDDWIVAVLYDSAAEAAPADQTGAKLEQIQQEYDAATPERKAELKAPSERLAVEDGTLVLRPAE